MPIYEFRCPGCGELFEKLVFSSSGDTTPTCPKCGQEDTTRVLSGFATGNSGSSGSNGGGDSSHSCSGGHGGFS